MASHGVDRVASATDNFKAKGKASSSKLPPIERVIQTAKNCRHQRREQRIKKMAQEALLNHMRPSNSPPASHLADSRQGPGGAAYGLSNDDHEQVIEQMIDSLNC